MLTHLAQVWLHALAVPAEPEPAIGLHTEFKLATRPGIGLESIIVAAKQRLIHKLLCTGQSFWVTPSKNNIVRGAATQRASQSGSCAKKKGLACRLPPIFNSPPQNQASPADRCGRLGVSPPLKLPSSAPSLQRQQGVVPEAKVPVSPYSYKAAMQDSAPE